MDYIKIKVSNLSVNDDIVWNGRVCRVVEKLGPLTIKVREYKYKGVALEEFKDEWFTISEDLIVDKVIAQGLDPIVLNLWNNVVIQYKMNDNTSSKVVIDSKGNSNGTSVQNTEDISVGGKVGRALSFNGSTDYVDCNDILQSTFRDSFSVMVGVKFDNLANSPQTFFGVSYAPDFWAVSKVGVGLYNGPTGVARSLAGFYTSNLKITQAYTTNSVLEAGDSDWHLVHMVVDNNTRQIYLYMDGSNLELGVATQPSDGKFDWGSTNVVMADYESILSPYLGAFHYKSSIGYQHIGDIDNFILFNKALTQQEITLLYDNGNWVENIPH